MSEEKAKNKTNKKNEQQTQSLSSEKEWKIVKWMKDIIREKKRTRDEWMRQKQRNNAHVIQENNGKNLANDPEKCHTLPANQRLWWFHANVCLSPSLPLCFLSWTHTLLFGYFFLFFCFFSWFLVIQWSAPFCAGSVAVFIFRSFGSVCLFSLSLQWATIECVYATVKSKLLVLTIIGYVAIFFYSSLVVWLLRLSSFWMCFFFYPVFVAVVVLYIMPYLYWSEPKTIHPKIVSLYGFYVFFLIMLLLLSVVVLLLLPFCFSFSFTVYFVPAVCLYLRHTLQ